MITQEEALFFHKKVERCIIEKLKEEYNEDSLDFMGYNSHTVEILDGRYKIHSTSVYGLYAFEFNIYNNTGELIIQYQFDQITKKIIFTKYTPSDLVMFRLLI